MSKEKWGDGWYDYATHSQRVNEVFELFIYEIDSYINGIKRKGSNKEKLRYLAGKLKHNKR